MKLNASTPEAHTPEAHTPVDMVTATHRMSNARPPGFFFQKERPGSPTSETSDLVVELRCARWPRPPPAL